MRFKFGFFGLLNLLLTACEFSGVEQINQKQEEINDTAALSVPFPEITRFQELKTLSKLYSIRDKDLETFSFAQANDGSLIKICNSYGFGIPYGLQFSNPEKLAWHSSSSTSLPQAEPNGTYTGTVTSTATWLLCFGPGGLFPLYWEGPIVVSPVDITGPMVKAAYSLQFEGKKPLITETELSQIQKEVRRETQEK